MKSTSLLHRKATLLLILHYYHDLDEWESSQTYITCNTLLAITSGPQDFLFTENIIANRCIFVLLHNLFRFPANDGTHTGMLSYHIALSNLKLFIMGKKMLEKASCQVRTEREWVTSSWWWKLGELNVKLLEAITLQANHLPIPYLNAN